MCFSIVRVGDHTLPAITKLGPVLPTGDRLARNRNPSPAFTGVAGKATGCYGELHCELFNVKLRRVPRAPQSAGDHLTRSRRFPPPWSVEEEAAYYVVRDHDGQQLGYVYFEEGPGRRSAAKLLTRDAAQRIAANIAKLSKLLPKRIP
jgi:hypothetical protein